MSDNKKKINKKMASAVLVSLALSIPIVAKSLKSEDRAISLYAVPDNPVMEQPADTDINNPQPPNGDISDNPKTRIDIGATTKYGVPVIPPEKPRKKIIPAQPIEKPVIRSLYAVPDEPRFIEKKFETREMPALKYAPPEIMIKKYKPPEMIIEKYAPPELMHEQNQDDKN